MQEDAAAPPVAPVPNDRTTGNSSCCKGKEKGSNCCKSNGENNCCGDEGVASLGDEDGGTGFSDDASDDDDIWDDASSESSESTNSYEESARSRRRGTMSGADLVSTTDDPFDSLLNLEQKIVDEGMEAGIRQGRILGMEQGRLLGSVHVLSGIPHHDGTASAFLDWARDMISVQSLAS